jgi:hypothetical protein
MITTFQSPALRDSLALSGLLRELSGLGRGLERTVLGSFLAGRNRYEIPRLRFQGPRASHDPIRLGIFAGIHGDEPAGCIALARFASALAAAPSRATGYDLYLYPVVNPTGFERGTRENHSGLDLNREFWRDSAEPEVRILQHELRAVSFDGIITLHADDTSEGVYGYAQRRALDEALLGQALRAAEAHLPRDRRSVIDGFAARDGFVGDCYEGVLRAPGTQDPQPFDLIFETPALSPLESQIEASIAALDSILASYRGFLAYAVNL